MNIYLSLDTIVSSSVLYNLDVKNVTDMRFMNWYQDKSAAISYHQLPYAWRLFTAVIHRPSKAMPSFSIMIFFYHGVTGNHQGIVVW
jgi:hypothetical protein